VPMNFFLNIFNRITFLENKLKFIEKKLVDIEENVELKNNLIKSNLIRIKNNEYVSSNIILSDLTYNDIDPEKAYKELIKPLCSHIVIDVSEEGHKEISIPNSIHIPLESLNERSKELVSKNSHYLIISEKGLRSILACEVLSELGFSNITNISGGHLYWPGHQEKFLNAG